MAHTIHFEDKGRTPLCLACEEMLTDAVDHTLSEADQAWFDQHVAGCVDCARMVADAQRGAAWLELLMTPRPEPSASLIQRIMAQTGGGGVHANEFAPAVVGQPAISPAAIPGAALVAARSNLLAFHPRVQQLGRWTTVGFQPRLAMTAAMAFFSIALTLNLTGVRLDRLHASSLNPANLKRSYYEADADAVRFYDNLRVVRVMESRVDDLRTSNTNASREDERGVSPDTKPQAKPEPSPTKPVPEPGGGMSQRLAPLDRPLYQTTGFTGGIPIAVRREKGGLV